MKGEDKFDAGKEWGFKEGEARKTQKEETRVGLCPGLERGVPHLQRHVPGRLSAPCLRTPITGPVGVPPTESRTHSATKGLARALNLSKPQRRRKGEAKKEEGEEEEGGEWKRAGESGGPGQVASGCQPLAPRGEEAREWGV